MYCRDFLQFPVRQSICELESFEENLRDLIKSMVDGFALNDGEIVHVVESSPTSNGAMSALISDVLTSHVHIDAFQGRIPWHDRVMTRPNFS